MFLPSGYHIDAAVSEGEKSPSQEAPVPFTYPAGIGGVLMNGCWGTDYKENDPCYNSKTTEDNCDVSNIGVIAKAGNPIQKFSG